MLVCLFVRLTKSNSGRVIDCEPHRPVIQALEIIKKYARTKVQHFPIEEDIPLDFLPPLWREAAVDDEVDGRPYINRITYEIGFCRVKEFSPETALIREAETRP
jgi:hypothetical protein